MSIENYITQKTKRSIIINVQDEEQNAKSICTDEVDKQKVLSFWRLKNSYLYVAIEDNIDYLSGCRNQFVKSTIGLQIYFN